MFFSTRSVQSVGEEITERGWSRVPQMALTQSARKGRGGIRTAERSDRADSEEARN